MRAKPSQGMQCSMCSKRRSHWKKSFFLWVRNGRSGNTWSAGQVSRHDHLPKQGDCSSWTFPNEFSAWKADKFCEWKIQSNKNKDQIWIRLTQCRSSGKTKNYMEGSTGNSGLILSRALQLEVGKIAFDLFDLATNWERPGNKCASVKWATII